RARVRRAAPRRLRDDPRRARLLALRRPAAAARARARDPRRPTRARPRRRDLRGRRRDGARDSRCARDRHGRQDHTRDHAPAGDDRTRRPGRRPGARPRRRRGYARGAAAAVVELSTTAGARGRRMTRVAGPGGVRRRAGAALRPQLPLVVAALAAVVASTAIAIAGPLIVRYA